MKHNVHAADAQLGAQRAEEFRTALDLKLTVAEAYVGVLRAEKDLAVAESNVGRLSAFLRDVQNRKSEGLATLNDKLSADVSLSNARQDQIRIQKNLSVAWARYNRYLGRPLTATTRLTEVSVPPASGEHRRPDLDDAEVAARARGNQRGPDPGPHRPGVANAARAGRPDRAGPIADRAGRVGAGRLTRR